MDTSIRFYNTNSSLRSVRDTERKNRPTSPLTVDEESYAETANVGEEVVDTHPQLSVPALQEQVQKVDVADFEAIFLRFQGPITNFIYHLIGNREQAYDLAQDVFVKAYKALLGGTVVQPGALSAWLYRIAANTTTDTLRRRRLIAWLPLSLFNEDRGIGAGVLSDSGGAVSDGFSSNEEDSSSGRASNISSMYERGAYDGGRFEGRVADREIVERVFKQLPPKYAVCLWLYENDGLSCAEIAEILNISASAVKMRLMRARERFINLYKQEVSEA
ncbi:MAG TPA: RNA polymerase sigma factor [Ktedonobacteraceae bacterium]|jgi:RNA polymerase sigma-70 factor (ECF subfamily)|nr:RNA polymerase sigma factor [Ktedonobacteraceae bacterium]